MLTTPHERKKRRQQERRVTRYHTFPGPVVRLLALMEREPKCRDWLLALD